MTTYDVTSRPPRAYVGTQNSYVGPATGERPYGDAYKDRLLSFGSRMLTMGCLALDDGEGQVVVGKRGTEVRWRETSASTHARWSSAFDAMRRIYDSLGGEVFLDAYRKDGTVSTAHPLGGCRMSADARSGVVSELGEVFGEPNLFVIDSAIIPSALGVNPSLTIAAVAERICDALIGGKRTTSLEARLAPGAK
jgi:cholesterol oxidase